MKNLQDQICYGMAILARVLLLLRPGVSLLRLKGEYFSTVLFQEGWVAPRWVYSCP